MKLTEAKLKQMIVEMMDDPLADKAAKIDSLLSGLEEDMNQGIELLMVVVEMFPDANKSPAMRQVAMNHYKNLQSELKELEKVVNTDLGYHRFIGDRVEDEMNRYPYQAHRQNSSYELRWDYQVYVMREKYPLASLRERYSKLLNAVQVFVDNFFYE